MRIHLSALKALVFTTALAPVLLQAAVLEISLDPAKSTTAPLKPGVNAPFKITNNASKAHTITKVTVNGKPVDGCKGTSISAGDSCKFEVTPTEYGTLVVRAEARDGMYKGISDSYTVALRFASYNLSFDRECVKVNGTVQCQKTGFQVLKEQMALSRSEQDALLTQYEKGELSGEQETLAKAVIQIRNVAEVIQRTSPDVFVLGEFDNNGIADDQTAINDFQTNYLGEPQKNDLLGLTYAYKKNVPTNTGKPSGFDLNNDGATDGPDDAWGFGNYYGQYAFAIFSRYEFDESKYRTFQNFKWKNVDGEKNPVITICDDPKKPIPANRTCGDSWYSPDVWEQMPVSSKNHIDLPFLIPESSNSGFRTVHFLVSHPTPPIFDGCAQRNYQRNRAEIKFWTDYIDVNGKTNFVDDANVGGGLPKDAYFVIAGDLNADPDEGDGHRPTIKGLMNSSLINTKVTTGPLQPTSRGGQEYLNSSTCTRNCKRTKGNTITSTSGLRLDHVMPSAQFTVLRSGVFWPATGEPGRDLVYDATLGVSKGVSSDHRVVWVDLYIAPDSIAKSEL